MSKWLGENVSQLIVSGDVVDIDLAFLNTLTNEMITHLDVLASLMKNWILA
jgi:hypothetical protein